MSEFKGEPKICELLGVHVGQWFALEGGGSIYRINSNGKIHNGYANMESDIICDLINGKRKIDEIRPDPDLPKAIKKLYPWANKIYADEFNDLWLASDTHVGVKLFPIPDGLRLKAGQEITL